MNSWFAGAVFLAFSPLLAAQASSEVGTAWTPGRAQGYTFFGLASSLGDATNVMNVGGGGEAFLYRGLAAGGDMSYLYAAGRFGYGFGLGTANLSYHFRGLDSNGRWVPFVTGGYALGFRNGTVNLANYGGGVTYWFRPHWGARVEVRNVQRSHVSSVLFRFGLSFR